QQWLPQRSLRIRTTTDCSVDAFSAPNLILLRPSSSPFDENLARFLQAKSANVSVFGLFCVGWENRNESFQSVVKYLDDFLPCPFNHVDLLVRIQRLFSGPEESTAVIRGRSLKEKFHLEMLIGESEPFITAIEKIPPVAESDFTVMITG